jgi:hypothetical protein
LKNRIKKGNQGMKNLQKTGAFAAIYLALAYLIGIGIFLVVLDYPSMTDTMQKVVLLIEQQGIIFWTNILMYVLFGLALVVFALALQNRVQEKAPALAQVATIIALIWAGSLIASGMVANAGIQPVIALYETDPAQAALLWNTYETVASGLGNGNGEILGGMWTLLISLAALKTASSPKALSYLGGLVGAIGIFSELPGMADLAGLFGMFQIIWFVWWGINIFRHETSMK